MRHSCVALLTITLLALAGCGVQTTDHQEVAVESPDLLDKYTAVRLTADLSGLTSNQRQMIPLLIEAAEAMDEIFWMQAYGDRDELLESIAGEDLDGVITNRRWTVDVVRQETFMIADIVLDVLPLPITLYERFLIQDGLILEIEAIFLNPF